MSKHTNLAKQTPRLKKWILKPVMFGLLAVVFVFFGGSLFWSIVWIDQSPTWVINFYEFLIIFIPPRKLLPIPQPKFSLPSPQPKATGNTHNPPAETTFRPGSAKGCRNTVGLGGVTSIARWGPQKDVLGLEIAGNSMSFMSFSWQNACQKHLLQVIQLAIFESKTPECCWWSMVFPESSEGSWSSGTNVQGC